MKPRRLDIRFVRSGSFS